MRVITDTCPASGSLVSANELEAHRVMKCPGLGCDEEFKIEESAEEDREHHLETDAQ